MSPQVGANVVVESKAPKSKKATPKAKTVKGKAAKVAPKGKAAKVAPKGKGKEKAAKGKKAAKALPVARISTDTKRSLILKALAKAKGFLNRKDLVQATGSNNLINTICRALTKEGLIVTDEARLHDDIGGGGFVYKITAKGSKVAAKG